MHARADDRRDDGGREVAVADQTNARAGRADVGDQLLVARPIEHHDDEIVHLAVERPGNRLQVVGNRRVDVDRVLRGRRDDELLHVEIGRMEEPAAFGGGEHRDRAGRSRGAQVRALERIDGDVDLRRPKPCAAAGAPDVRQPDALADVEHRRLVALPLADDDAPVDRHAIELAPHRFDGGVIRPLAVAQAHGVGARDRGLLDDAEELEGEIRFHQRIHRGHARGRDPVTAVVDQREATVGCIGGRSQRVGRSVRYPST